MNKLKILLIILLIYIILRGIYLIYYHKTETYENPKLIENVGTYYPNTPLLIPGLTQWFDAVDPLNTGIQPDNGASISVWKDKSGNGNDIFNYNGPMYNPTYATNTVNSLPAVYFNNKAGLMSAPISKSQNITIFVVVNFINNNNAHFHGTVWGHFANDRRETDIVLRRQGNDNNICIVTNNSDTRVNIGMGNQPPAIVSGMMTGGRFLYIQTINNSNTSYSRDVVDKSWQPGSAPVWVGMDTQNNQCFESHICEIIYYQRNITLTERQGIEGYLAWKWGLQSYLPPSVNGTPPNSPYLTNPPIPITTGGVTMFDPTPPSFQETHTLDNTNDNRILFLPNGYTYKTISNDFGNVLGCHFPGTISNTILQGGNGDWGNKYLNNNNSGTYSPFRPRNGGYCVDIQGAYGSNNFYGTFDNHLIYFRYNPNNFWGFDLQENWYRFNYSVLGMAVLTDKIVYALDFENVQYNDTGNWSNVRSIDSTSIYMVTDYNMRTKFKYSTLITNPALQTFKAYIDGSIRGPFGMSVSTNNVLYICDTFNHVIKMIQNTVMTVVAGVYPQATWNLNSYGSATSITLDRPGNCVYYNAGNILFFIDGGYGKGGDSGQMVRFLQNGIVGTVTGSGDGSIVFGYGNNNIFGIGVNQYTGQLAITYGQWGGQTSGTKYNNTNQRTTVYISIANMTTNVPNFSIAMSSVSKPIPSFDAWFATRNYGDLMASGTYNTNGVIYIVKDKQLYVTTPWKSIIKIQSSGGDWSDRFNGYNNNRYEIFRPYMSTAANSISSAPGSNNIHFLMGINYLYSTGLNSNPGGFLPSSVSGLQLWLDGADPAATGTKPAINSTVALWKDKSGNSRHGTSVGNSTFTSNGISFNGMNQYYRLPNGSIPNSGSYTIMVVVNFTSETTPNNTQNGILSTGVNGTQNGSMGLRANNRLDIENYWYWTNQINMNRFGPNNLYPQQGYNFMYTVKYNSSNNTRTSYYNSWTCPTQDTPGTYNVQNNNCTIGKTEDNWWMYGTIQEVLVYNTALSDTDRQNIDAYLNIKWNIKSDYLTVPTLVASFNKPGGIAVFSDTLVYVSQVDTNSITVFNNGAQSTLTYTTNIVGPQATFNKPRGLAVAPDGTLFIGDSGNHVIKMIKNGVMTVIAGNMMMDARDQNTVNEGSSGPFSSGPGHTINIQGGYFLDYYAPTNMLFFLDGNNGDDDGKPGGQIRVYQNGYVGTVWGTTDGTFNWYDMDTCGQVPGFAIDKVNGIIFIYVCNQQCGTIPISKLLINLPPAAALLNTPAATPSTTTSPVQGFLPTSISNLDLWIDGNDPWGTGITPGPNGQIGSIVNKGLAPIAILGNTQNWPNYPSYVPNFNNSGNGCLNFNKMWYDYSDNNETFKINLSNRTVFIVASTYATPTDSTSFFFLGRPNNDMINSNEGVVYDGPNPGKGSSMGFVYQQNQGLPNGYYVSAGAFGNTPLAIYCDTCSGKNVNMYVNGGLISSVTLANKPGIAEGFRIGARPQNVDGKTMQGYICDILVYNKALTTTERQKVEGYLSWKWGLNNFKPTSIPNLLAWYDAKDPANNGTLPSDGDLTSWKDKSGNGNDLSNSFGTPKFSKNLFGTGLGGIDFSTNSAYRTNNNLQLNRNLTVFIVATIKSTDRSWGSLLNHESNGHDSLFNIRRWGNSMDFHWKCCGNDTERINVNDSVPSLFYGTMVNGNFCQWTYANANRTQSMYSTFDDRIGGGTSQQLWIGGDNANESSSSYMAEVIYYNALLSPIQITTIANSLNTKWNLNINFGSPSSFIPTSISGLNVWYDGKDPANNGTLPGDGTKLSVWKDKSGNNRDVTTTNVPQNNDGPMFKQNLFGPGLGGLDFTSNSALKTQNEFSVSQNFTIFLVVNIYPANNQSWNSFFNHESNGHDSMLNIRRYSGNNWQMKVSGNEINNNNAIDVGVPSIIYGVCKEGNKVHWYYINSLHFNTISNYNFGNQINGQNHNLWIGGDNNGGQSSCQSYMGEVLYYNNILTNSQILTTLNYLNGKWNIGIPSGLGLPGNHPYISNPPINAVSSDLALSTALASNNTYVNNSFTSNLVLWLDAADPANTGILPRNGTSISSWVDKSPNNNSAKCNTTSFATVKTRMLNDYPVLYFNGVNRYDVNFSTSYPQYTVISVVFFTADNQKVIAYNNDESGGVGINGGNYYQTWTNNSATWVEQNYNIPNGLGRDDRTPAFFATDTFAIYENTYNSTTTTPLVNGLQLNPKPNNNSNLSNINIGQSKNNSGNNPFNGYIAEIMVFNTILSTGVLQNVEGYLAWKWGINSMLPCTHPYYFTNPLSVMQTPVIGGYTSSFTGSASNPVSNLVIIWTEPVSGGSFSFLLNPGSGVPTTVVAPTSANSTSATFGNLTPGITYTVVVNALPAPGINTTPAFDGVCSPLPPNNPIVPQNYFPLQNDFNDIGSNPQTITNNGGVSISSNNNKSGANFTNNRGQYLSFPFIHGNTFTISWWGLITGGGTLSIWSFAKTGDNSNHPGPGFFIQPAGGGNGYQGLMFPGGRIDLSGAPNVSNNVWYHYTITVDMNTGICNYFVNGSLKITQTGSGGVIPDLNYIIINNDAYEPNQGLINYFSVYNSALTATQVMSLYTLSPYSPIPTKSLSSGVASIPYTFVTAFTPIVFITKTATSSYLAPPNPSIATINLGWAPIVGATSYTYTVSPALPANAQVPPMPLSLTNPAMTFSQLLPSTQYTFTVNINVMVNNNPTAISTPSVVVITTPPPSPTLTIVPGSRTSTSFNVTWPIIESSITSYIYTLNNTVIISNVSQMTNPPAGTSGITFSNLNSGSTFSIGVTPVLTIGGVSTNGVISTLSNITTLPLSISITSPTITSSTQAVINWSGGTTGVTYYYATSTSSTQPTTFLTTSNTTCTITNLLPATIYYCWVLPVVVDSTGTTTQGPIGNISGATGVGPFKFITLPTTVTVPQLQVATTTTASVNWSASTGATGYTFSISPALPSGAIISSSTITASSTTIGTSAILPVSPTSLFFSGLTAGLTYSVAITAFNIDQNSTNKQLTAASPQLQFTTLPAPITSVSAPTSLILYNGFTLQWPQNTSASSFTYTGIPSGVTIGLPTTTNNITSVIIGGPGTNVIGITPGIYPISITPVDIGGSGTPISITVTTLPAAMSSFTTPTNVTAISFTISWAAVTNATSYSWIISPVAPTGATLPSSSIITPSLTFNGLSPSTTYTLTVTPQNTSGGGTSGSTTINTLPATTVPTGVATATTITASWGSVIGNPVYYYTCNKNTVLAPAISYTSASASAITGSTSNLSPTTSFGGPQNPGTLTPGATYWISVTPVIGTSWGTASSTSIVTLANQVDTVNLTPDTLTNNGFTVNWVAPAGASTYNYSITPQGGASSTILNTTSLSQVFTGLSAGVSYTVSVASVNSAGVASASTQSSVITCLPNAITTQPTVNITLITTSSFVVQFASTIGATNYIYTMDPTTPLPPNARGVFSTTTAANLLTFTGLNSGKLYKFTISGTNISGSGGASPSTSSVTLPDAITNLSCNNITQNGFSLQWPNDSSASGYLYTINNQAVSPTQVSTVIGATNTSAVFTGLINGTLYSVQVVPTSNNGALSGTPTSLTGGVTTLPQTLSSIDLQPGSITSNSFTVIWPSSQGATGYNYTILPAPPAAAILPSMPVVSPLTFTGLNTNTSYVVSIIPTNTSNGIMQYGPATSSSSLTTLPAQLKSLSVTSITSTRIIIAWVASPTDTTFQYTILNPDTTSVTNVTTQNTATFNGLVSGGNYSISVSSINSIDSSIKSIATSIIVETLPNSLQSIGFDITSITTSGFTVNWISDGSSSKYFYTISPNPAPQTYMTSATSNIFTGLISGTSYTVQVTPVNLTNGQGTPSSITIMTLPSAVSPSASQPTTNSFNVSWLAVTGAAKYSYTITESDNLTTITQSTTLTSISLTSLNPGVKYNVLVWAVNANGMPGPTPSGGALSVTTLPPKVTGLTSSNINVTSFTLTWPFQPTVDSYKFIINNLQPNIPIVPVSNSTTNLTTATIRNLNPGTIYNISVISVDESGEGEPTPITVITPPNPITQINPSAITPTSFNLQWQNDTSASTFTYTLNGITTLASVSSSTTTTTATFGGLISGSLYAVIVTPKYNNVSGTPYPITITTLPATISALTVPSSTLTPTSCSITWTNVFGATTYTCTVSPASTSGTTFIFTSSPATITGLSPGTIYNISITPSNAGGSGAPTNVSVTTLPSAIGTPIITLITSSSFTSSWSPVSGATSYAYTLTNTSSPTITYAPSLSNPNSLGVVHTTTSLSQSFTALNPGSTYSLILTPTIGTLSGASATVTIITQPTPISSGTLQSSAVSSNGFTVTWPPSTGATGYIYSISPIGSTSTTSNTTTLTTITFTNLSQSAGTTYTVSVTPTCGTVQGRLGSFLVTTLPNPITVTPTVSNISQYNFTVKWLASVGATSYTYTINPSPNPALITNSTNALQQTFTGLAAGTQYTIQIIPTNIAGSADAITVNGTTFPPPISGYTANNILDTNFMVSWLSEPTATNYIYTINGSILQNQPVTTIGTTYTNVTFTNLFPGTIYNLTVAAADVSGAGPPVTIPTVLTLPDSISTLYLQAGSLTTSGFTITWSSIYGASGYNYTISPSPDVNLLPINGTNNNSITFTGLTGGASYAVTVTPNNITGSALKSAALLVVTEPSPITGLTVSAISTTSINFKWDAGIGDVNYLYSITSPAITSPVPSSSIFSPSMSAAQVQTYVVSPTFSLTDITTANSLHLTGLYPGAIYTINILPLNINNVAGDPISMLVETLPNGLVSLGIDVTTITTSTASIMWLSDYSSVSYQYSINPDPRNIGPITTSSSSATLTGLTAGTTYNVSIIPINSTNGKGTASSISFITLPNPVTLSVSLLSSYGFQVSWTSVSGAISYSYTLTSSNSIDTSTHTTTLLFTTFSGLNPNVTYNVVVSPINNNNLLGKPSHILVTTLPQDISSLTSSNITLSGFTLSWPIDPSATNFSFLINSTPANPDSITSTPLTTTAIFSELLPGTSYIVSVTPLDSAGAGNPTTITVVTEPESIHNLTISSVKDTSVTLTWPLDSSATSFVYKINNTVVIPDNENSNTTITNATFKGLISGTQYTIQITPFVGNEDGEPTSISFTTLPSAISSISSTNVTSSGFILTWPTDPSATDFLYTINNKDAIPESVSVTTTIIKAKFINLLNGTLYNISITPIDEAGSGESYNIVVTTLPGNIDTINSSNITQTSFTLSWIDNTNATSYEYNINPTIIQTPNTIIGKTTIVNFTNLTPNTSYSIDVIPTNSSGVANTYPIIVSTLQNYVYTSPSASLVLQSDTPDTSTDQVDTQIYTPSISEVIQNISDNLSSVSPTSNPGIIKSAIDSISKTLKGLNSNKPIKILNQNQINIIYSYYTKSNPNFNSSLPLIALGTTLDSNGNQSVDVNTISSTGPTNVLLPLGPGESVVITGYNITITRGSLTDKTAKNQTNQITSDKINWISFNQELTIGNYSFLFAGAGSPTVFSVTPQAPEKPEKPEAPETPETPDSKQVTQNQESSTTDYTWWIVGGVSLLLLGGVGYYLFNRSKPEGGEGEGEGEGDGEAAPEPEAEAKPEPESGGYFTKGE
jgi:hypothetical protein